MINREDLKWHKRYQGARWVKVDLHLHSPGAHTFSLPSSLSPDRDRGKIADLYVQKLFDQGIQVAAITDYQGIRTKWFSLIQQKARERGIVVFPGAELSFKGPKHGLHILAVFPLDADPEAINRSILALDRNPADLLVRSDGSHRDIDPGINIKDALLRLRNQFTPSPLFIVAHPSDDNGLLKSFSPKDAAEFIWDIQPDAIEDSLSERDVNRLASTGVLKRGDLMRIARVRFSDPKRVEDIGTKVKNDGELRATWLKLSVFDDLNALRLALHDTQILVKVGENPKTSYTRLLGLEVDGNGFLGGLSLAFSPELNVLVGGRGVGKSAILETIRYVVDFTSYGSNEYRESLVRYALGSGGKAVLYLEQDIGPARRYYRIERVWGEHPHVFEIGVSGEHMVNLAPLDILKGREAPLFFSQKEIYEVSRDESRRLRLVDEIIGRKAKAQLLQVRKLEQQLRDNARQVLERRAQLEEEEEIEHRLNEIKHEIDLYRREGLVERLKEATALTADEERLRQAEKAIQEDIEAWEELARIWADRWQEPRRQLGEAESIQRELLQEAQEILHSLGKAVESVFRQGKDHLEKAKEDMQHLLQRWEEGRQPLDEHIRKVKQELGRDSLDPDQLVRLTEEQTQLQPRLRLLEKVRAEVGRLEKEREKLLRELRDARWEAWKLRNHQAQLLTRKLQGRVRAEVEYKGQRKTFVERLADLFQGSGVDRKSLDRLASGDGVDGEVIARTVREGSEKLAERFGLTPGRAQQMHNYLTQNERLLFELELLAPEDALRVYLKLNETEQPLEKLSDGQRATAMLLLLLVQEDRALIVDQPEDDLDNRFIYEDIVRILRDHKSTRQILAATHNPNIPVLGHAELIVALEATESKAKIAALGSIDRTEVQEFVKEVMEGGKDAFRRRAEKYGWV